MISILPFWALPEARYAQERNHSISLVYDERLRTHRSPKRCLTTIGVGRIFSRRGTVVKFDLNNSKLREQPCSIELQQENIKFQNPGTLPLHFRRPCPRLLSPSAHLSETITFAEEITLYASVFSVLCDATHACRVKTYILLSFCSLRSPTYEDQIATFKSFSLAERPIWSWCAVSLHVRRLIELLYLLPVNCFFTLVHAFLVFLTDWFNKIFVLSV